MKFSSLDKSTGGRGKIRHIKNTTSRLRAFLRMEALYIHCSRCAKRSAISSSRWGEYLVQQENIAILNPSVSASLRCQHRPLSNLVSGVSMRCSSHNNTLPVRCKTPSISLVCNSFYIFDCLVTDVHYDIDPSVSLPPPAEYYKRVAKVHEHGGYGSTGYRAPWSDEESRKLLLRTHTTASSAAMLWKLAAKCRGEP